MKIATIAPLAALLVLGACASGPEVAEGNPRSVMVGLDDANEVKGALKAADQHCARYNRTAQFKGRMTESQLAYDCVE